VQRTHQPGLRTNLLIGSNCVYFRPACRFATSNLKSHTAPVPARPPLFQAIAYFYNNRIHEKRVRRLRQTAYNFLVSCVYYIATRPF